MQYRSLLNSLKAAAAAGCALALSLSLAACGGGSNSSDSKSSDSSSKSSSSDKSSTKLHQIAGVTATGKLGEKPKINVPKGMTVENNSYAILQKGNGETIEDGDRVCSQGQAISASDGKTMMSTWEKNTPDCSMLVSKGSMNEQLYDIIKGQKLNTTFAMGVNDSNSSGTSYIMALTFVSKSRDLERAEGDEVKDVPADLPKVTRGKDGKPSIDMNGYKPSGDKLITQTLIQGKGKKVTDGNTVVVKYTGWLTNGKQFDSSWDRGETLQADAFSGGQHQVIEGWQKGMVGQAVGSQVLMIIPPDLAYGKNGQGSIPANSWLIFVVDILAAY